MRPADRVVELLLLGLVAYVTLSQPPVRKVLASLPGRVRVVAVALTLATYGGHVFGGSRHALPFIPWNMYSQPPEGPVRTYTFTGTTRSGQVVNVVPTVWRGRLRTPLVPFGLHEQAAQVTRDTERGQAPLSLARLRGNLLALARLHEEKLTHVQVTQVTFPPDTFTRGSEELRLVWEFEVP